MCVCVCPFNLCATYLFAQARKDWFFIAMPNAMGVAFNTVSLFLCAVLPARDRQGGKDDNDAVKQQPSMLKRMLQSFKGTSSDASSTETSESHEIDLAVDTMAEHAHTK